MMALSRARPPSGLFVRLRPIVCGQCSRGPSPLEGSDRPALFPDIKKDGVSGETPSFLHM